MYRIYLTTDGKYTGRLITQDEIDAGEVEFSDDFVFEIDRKKVTSRGAKLFSANYVVYTILEK